MQPAPLMLPPPDTLAFLRRAYQQAVHSERATRDLLRWVDRQPSPSPLILAYRAAALGFAAKHALLPLDKLTQIEAANRAFAHAVAQDPDNIEIRFLRFAIQIHLPAFLNQSRNIDDDKRTIAAHLHRHADFALSRAEAAVFAELLRKSGRCSPAELQALAPF